MTTHMMLHEAGFDPISPKKGELLVLSCFVCRRSVASLTMQKGSANLFPWKSAALCHRRVDCDHVAMQGWAWLTCGCCFLVCGKKTPSDIFIVSMCYRLCCFRPKLRWRRPVFPPPTHPMQRENVISQCSMQFWATWFSGGSVCWS